MHQHEIKYPETHCSHHQNNTEANEAKQKYSCHSDMNHGHHAAMIQDYKRRFLFSSVLTIPVLLLSPMIQMLFNFNLILPGNSYILLGLSTLIFIYGGWPFIKGLYQECKAKNPGMMTLIGIAIVTAYFYSAATVFGLVGNEFFWELVTLIDIMLLGHWIEMRSVLGASRTLEYLVKMLPQSAHLIKYKTVIDVKLGEIQVDDIILIKPGEKVPADGEIIEGLSYLNESMLTGESKPVKKEIDGKVIAGSINGNGAIKVKVQHTGKDLYLSKVITLVEEAQTTKSKTQDLVNQAAKWLTFIAIIIGLGSFLLWLSLGKEIAFALERMVTVMVISCPHALGLAVPLVAAISTTLAAQHGLLIRNRTAFENARKITTIVFDKTGTLTKGSFDVVRYESLNQKYSNDEILVLAASIEQNSEHPIATGIIKLAKDKNLTLEPLKDFQAIPGKGVEATIQQKNIKLVSPNYLTKNNITFHKLPLINATETIVVVLINNEIAGLIALADEIREESYPAIAAFKKIGIKTLMLTGDNAEVAKATSQKLAIDSYRANVLPHQKRDIIKELQDKGEFVAMTGDGVNDAPALAQANVGIAIGSGTDVAAETADIILVTNNPKDIVSLILFGKATYRKMIQNLIWATGYNIVAIPLAAGALAYFGLVLSPAIGAIFMSLSTVIAAFNAQLLKKSGLLKLNLVTK